MSSSCLRSSLGELGVVEATDELLDVGTNMRGGRDSTASINASACSNSTLRSLSVLAVDDWRLCWREWLAGAAAAVSASSSRLFSSSCGCCCLSAVGWCASFCGAFPRLCARRCCCCVHSCCISRIAALRVSIIPS